MAIKGTAREQRKRWATGARKVGGRYILRNTKNQFRDKKAKASCLTSGGLQVLAIMQNIPPLLTQDLCLRLSETVSTIIQTYVRDYA